MLEERDVNKRVLVCLRLVYLATSQPAHTGLQRRIMTIRSVPNWA